MKQKSIEVFLPGPSGRLEAKYYKNEKKGSPIAIVLHPHPQYGGTMNNRVVQEAYNVFVKNGFSVLLRENECSFRLIRLFCPPTGSKTISIHQTTPKKKHKLGLSTGSTRNDFLLVL